MASNGGLTEKSNGEITWRAKGPIPSDTGKSWIEGDIDLLSVPKEILGDRKLWDCFQKSQRQS